ncbi:MmoB/DmpM family protein [Amycolatopsis rubida]|uniref:Toluene monooxygenase system protein D n=1 Tax=Amycolatopsis rubida TaxID=112413 RepID=A0A1I5NCV8_9PSEU|nr:MmoB/DmpM family protein [Amycolatopsis rubida]SFP19619.1 toluene monooxygenase system protein D [Amycolatopsis rubida]
MAIDNAVGPVLRMCEEVDAVVAAIRDDNPDTEIEVIDRGSYVRVQATDKLVVTEATLQEHLGGGFQIRSLEGMLSSFAGRITTSSDRIEWQTGASRKTAVR